MSRPEGVEPGLLQIHLGAEIASDPADAWTRWPHWLADIRKASVEQVPVAASRS
jgi:hypothetical protein